jgi:D-alanine-D-alanine ligase
LGCRDAGRVDVRLDDAGRPQLLEVNPLAGLMPGYSDLPIMAERSGMSYVSLIAEILRSASARLDAA